MKTNILIKTIVEPIGVPHTILITIPTNEHTTERIALTTVTERKLLHTLIAESEGKIINAEISNEPTKFIASTIITAVSIAITKLYASVFVPVAVAKSSSNVSENILL